MKTSTAQRRNAQILAGVKMIEMEETTVEEMVGKIMQNIREGNMETIAQEIGHVQESGDEAVCQAFRHVEQIK